MMVMWYVTMPRNYYTSEPTRDFFLALRFFAFYGGIVIFPSCFAFAPLLKQHLPSSGTRRLLVGTGASAIAGFMEMVFLKLYAPYISSTNGFSLIGIATLVGASFGFFYVTLNRQTPNA